MYLKATPTLCQLALFNWVLTSLHFTLRIYIPLSLLSPFPSFFFFLRLSPHFFTAATANPFFGGGVFQRVSTFSILRCEIHFKSGLEIDWSNMPYLFSLPLFLPVFTSCSCLSLFHYFTLFICLFFLSLDLEIHRLTFHCRLSPGIHPTGSAWLTQILFSWGHFFTSFQHLDQNEIQRVQMTRWRVIKQSKSFYYLFMYLF